MRKLDMQCMLTWIAVALIPNYAHVSPVGLAATV